MSRPTFALRLSQYVRDEAHQVAQRYHHLLRKKRTLRDGGRLAANDKSRGLRIDYRQPLEACNRAEILISANEVVNLGGLMKMECYGQLDCVKSGAAYDLSHACE